MFRSFGTALFAVCLTGASLAPAEAKTHVSLPTVTTAALESGVVRHGSAETSETASTMPSANADLQMWSSTVASAVVADARSSDVAHHTSRKNDAMHRFARGIVSRTSSIAMSLTRSAMRFIGTPYVFGGTSPSGFDCSGYTQHVFAMLGIALPRTADAQYYAGRPTRGGMTTGDLVFFQTYEPGPSHVGIYLGHGRFVHSSSHGVMVSRLSDSYWRARYIGAKRLAKLD